MAVNNDRHLYSPKLLCVYLMTMERRLGMKQVYSGVTGYDFFPITTTYNDNSNPQIYIQVARNSFKYFPRLRL